MIHEECSHAAYLEYVVPFIEGIGRVTFHAVEIMQTMKMEEPSNNLPSLYGLGIEIREMIKCGTSKGLDRKPSLIG